MRFDRRGDLGFPEAIMAVMVVSLSLTAYIGVMAITIADDQDDADVRIDKRLFNGFTIEEDRIKGDIEESMIATMERHGYNGITIKCNVPGTQLIDAFSLTVGQMEGDIFSERHLISIKCDDGRTVSAIAEVIVCT